MVSSNKRRHILHHTTFHQFDWWPSFLSHYSPLLSPLYIRLALLQFHFLRQAAFSPANTLSTYVSIFLLFERRQQSVDFLRLILEDQNDLETLSVRFQIHRADNLKNRKLTLQRSREQRNELSREVDLIFLANAAIQEQAFLDSYFLSSFDGTSLKVPESGLNEVEILSTPFSIDSWDWLVPKEEPALSYNSDDEVEVSLEEWFQWDDSSVSIKRYGYWFGTLEKSEQSRRHAWPQPHVSSRPIFTLQPSLDYEELITYRFLFVWDFNFFLSMSNVPEALLSEIAPEIASEIRPATTLTSPKLLRVCKQSLESILQKRVYPLFAVLTFYRSFMELNLRQLALCASARLVRARDHSAQYRFFWNFQGRRLFLTLHDAGGEGYNYFFLSLGLFLKFFKYKKCLKKTKLMKLLLVKYARKLLIVTELEELHFRIRGIPALFPELLRVFLTPVVTPFRHPNTSLLYRDVEETQRRRPFFPMSIIHTRVKPYNYMRGKKKGRLKRKITKRLISQSRVCD